MDTLDKFIALISNAGIYNVILLFVILTIFVTVVGATILIIKNSSSNQPSINITINQSSEKSN